MMRLRFVVAPFMKITQIYSYQNITMDYHATAVGVFWLEIWHRLSGTSVAVYLLFRRRTQHSIFIQLLQIVLIQMLPINITRLRQESSLMFLSGDLQQGHQLIRQCIELQPQQSQHHVNKALFQYAMGNAKTALNDLHKAITLDHLNYQAYFNTFSIQMQKEEYQAAFKNLCCCMSVLHLLKAEKEEDLGEVEKAIEFSFNNKEARLFKSILKMQEKKNIEALNQINYAVYLDPSHSSLKIVQEKVYKMMGMKELTNKGAPLQKPKYDRLETNKEIPAGNKIKAEIEKMLREFNRLLKAVDTDQLYKVSLPKNEVLKPKEAKVEVANTIKPKLLIAQTKVIEQQCEESNLISDTSYKYKEDKTSTANNSEHIDLSTQQNHNKNEHFFLFQTSFSNISISDIGQNSKIESHRNFHGQNEAS